MSGFSVGLAGGLPYRDGFFGVIVGRLLSMLLGNTAAWLLVKGVTESNNGFTVLGLGLAGAWFAITWAAAHAVLKVIRTEDPKAAAGAKNRFLIQLACIALAGFLAGYGSWIGSDLYLYAALALDAVTLFLGLSWTRSVLRATTKRSHPYAAERSPDRELKMNPGSVTMAWLGLAAAMAVLGWFLSTRLSDVPGVGAQPWEHWQVATLVPLFGGIGLLGFSLGRKPGMQRFVMAGWIIFAFYWGLVALDLLVSENQDYVNYVFALVGVFFFTYLAYHEWLSIVRGVENKALRFLSVTTFVAAGSYFLIDKIQWLRLKLIYIVSDHTKWGLDLFGQGDKAGLQFVVDVNDPKSPTTFFYPQYYCNPNHVNEEGVRDAVGNFCASLPDGHRYVTTFADMLHPPQGWFDHLLLYTPERAADALQIVPVSIILACTAIQSIMLFVGLFFGTTASLGRKIKASLLIGGIVYLLNLVRNVGIIWFYGQGHASFWIMHNAIGKGGSLVAMCLIAFGVFRYFPEFFDGLVSVLDLPDRDGPMERFLKIGRRRPKPVEPQLQA